MTTAEEIAGILLKVKAVTVKVDPPFTWNTGLVAPIYCDNRIPLSYPVERSRIVAGYKELIAAHKLDFDVIAGTATAGIPWAAFLAQELNKPMVYVRSHPKDYGTAKCVEGFMPKGSRVLIIEDLISTGRSSMASIAACKKECDAAIVGVLAIFNYEMQKAKDTYTAEGISFYTLSNFSTLLKVAAHEHYITKEQEATARSWSADPEKWWDSISYQQ